MSVPKGNRDKVDSTTFRDCSLIGGPLSRGCDPWGLKQSTDRPREEWMVVPAPTLRMVSEDLWIAAYARLADVRSTYLLVRIGDSSNRRRKPEGRLLR